MKILLPIFFQSLELLKNFMNSKGMKSKTAELLTGADQEPIRPINAPSHFIPVKNFHFAKFK